jgi:hypothetical protein
VYKYGSLLEGYTVVRKSAEEIDETSARLKEAEL